MPQEGLFCEAKRPSFGRTRYFQRQEGLKSTVEAVFCGAKAGSTGLLSPEWCNMHHYMRLLRSKSACSGACCSTTRPAEKKKPRSAGKSAAKGPSFEERGPEGPSFSKVGHFAALLTATKPKGRQKATPAGLFGPKGRRPAEVAFGRPFGARAGRVGGT